MYESPLNALVISTACAKMDISKNMSKYTSYIHIVQFVTFPCRVKGSINFFMITKHYFY